MTNKSLLKSGSFTENLKSAFLPEWRADFNGVVRVALRLLVVVSGRYLIGVGAAYGSRTCFSLTTKLCTHKSTLPLSQGRLFAHSHRRPCDCTRLGAKSVNTLPRAKKPDFRFVSLGILAGWRLGKWLGTLSGPPI